MLDAGYGSSSRFYERAVAKARHAAGDLQAGRSRHEHALHDCGLAAWAAPGGRDHARRVRVAMGRSDVALRRALALEYPGAVIAQGPRRAQRMDDGDSRASVRAPAAARSAARRAGDGVSVAGLEGARRDSPRRNALVRRSGCRRSAGRGAARAVAPACATNPVALAIPCHRVVPAAGGVGGYRWGSLARKRRCSPLRVECRSDD